MNVYPSILRAMRKYLLAGIAVLFPLFISVYLVYLLFSLSDRIAGRFINAYLKDAYGFTIPGLGFLIILAVIIIAGIMVNHFITRRFFSLLDMLFMRIPLVSNLYPSAKQLSDFLFKSERRKEFNKVVLVEFPYPGAYSIGFVTNEALGPINTMTNKDMVNVYIALAPSPFSGFLVIVPRDKIKPLDISFEETIKYIVSGGVVFKPQEQA